MEQRTWRDWVIPALIVGLVHVSIFKSNRVLSWLPVDATLLLGAIVTVVLVAALLHARRMRIHPAMLAVLALFAFPWFWGEPNDYTGAKLIGSAATLVAVIATIYLVNSERRRKAWLYTVVALGAVAVLAARFLPQDIDYGRIALEGSNTIASGRLAGAALVIVAVLAISGGSRWWLLLVGLAAAFGGLMIATGSRGPVVAAVAAISAVALLSRVPRRGFRLILALGGLAAGWLLIQDSQSAGAARIAATLSGEASAISTRIDIWAAAIREIGNHPFGVGWSHFVDVLTAGERLSSGDRQYPHNVILEAAVEGGWLFGIAVAALIAIAVRRAWTQSTTPHAAAFLGLLLFTVINAMVSGDINDNRLMWACVALAWTLPRPPDAPTAPSARYLSARRTGRSSVT